MEVLVANVDHIKFDIDYALEEQYGALPLPFPGMDSKFYLPPVQQSFKLIEMYALIRSSNFLMFDITSISRIHRGCMRVLQSPRGLC